MTLLDRVKIKQIMDSTTDNEMVQDGWNVNVAVSTNEYTFDVPSFIRLFVINRILTKHPQNTIMNQEKLQTIVLALKDKQIHATAYKILSQLTQYGIKTYMDKCYNEKEQATTIELIFENIILIKFDNEYQQVTSYHDKNQQYQCKVFNNNDLMRKIFRYLTFRNGLIGDLYHCSLVNTCWLYHIWNTKLLYGKYPINSFLEATWKLSHEDNDIDNNVTRSWQRLVNVKSIVFRLNTYTLTGSPSNLVLSRLSMLRYLEEIDCHCDDTYFDVIKTIIQQCRDKIRSFKLYVNAVNSGLSTKSITYPVLSPLKLPNAKIISISMDYSLFYETWTKECDTLKIYHSIDEKWCKHVIDNCDCSGVKYLLIHYWNFFDEESNDPISISKNNIFKQFSQKFVNLQELIVHISPHTILPALSLLQFVSKSVVTKNKQNRHSKENTENTKIIKNTHTHVVIPQLLAPEYVDTTNNMIEQWVNINGASQNSIRKLKFEPNAYHLPCHEQMKILIKLCYKNLQWLSIGFDGYNIEEQRSLLKFIVDTWVTMMKIIIIPQIIILIHSKFLK